MSFISVKLNLLASLLQSSVSHDHSEIIWICWFAVQDIFIIIIKVENSAAVFIYYVLGGGGMKPFRFLWLKECSKEQLYETDFFVT